MFIESDSGRHINLDHIADLNPVVGGSYRLRWSSGMIETLSSTDGDAIRDVIREAIRSDAHFAFELPSIEKTATKPKKESKPRGRPRKTAAS